MGQTIIDEMRKTVYFVAFFFAIVLPLVVSCSSDDAVVSEPEQPSPQPEQSDPMITESNVTLVLSFNVDEVKGKSFGIIYARKNQVLSMDKSVRISYKDPEGFNGSLEVLLQGLTPSTTYNYCTFIEESDGSYTLGEQKSVTTAKRVVTRAPATPVAVDLGLRSGKRWANINLGAVDEKDTGNYYAWGSTTIQPKCEWSNYPFSYGGNSRALTKYLMGPGTYAVKNLPFGSFGFLSIPHDSISTLELADDVVYQTWGTFVDGSGQNWRWQIPTMEDWRELYYSTVNTWVCLGDSVGYEFTDGVNTIFIPAAGYKDDRQKNVRSIGKYWSATLTENYYQMAYGFMFYYQYGYISYASEVQRSNGCTIRAVCTPIP